jgi:hypothetical protein
MAKSKAEKNARRRELYAEKKAAGTLPPRKKGANPNVKTSKKSSAQKKSTAKTGSKKSQGKTGSTSKISGNHKSSGGNVPRGTKSKIGISFEQYIQRPENYGKTTNALVRGYRSIGGSVGRDASVQIVRDVLGRKYQPKKATRAGTSQKGTITYVKASDIDRKFYTDYPYIYIVKYYVEKEDMEESEVAYSTIAAREKLTKDEVIDRLFIQFDQMQSANESSKDGKYQAIGIDEEMPITIVRAIYNNTPQKVRPKKREKKKK